MTQVDDSGALLSWLENNPPEWAPALALRSALRVLPLIGGIAGDPKNSLRHLAVFRAMWLSWISRELPIPNIRSAAVAAAGAIDAVSTGGTEHYSIAADAAADAAEAIVQDANSASAGDSAQAAVGAVRAAAIAAGNAAPLWEELRRECAFLEQTGDARQLVRSPLWSRSPPTLFEDAWRGLSEAMTARDHNAWIWRIWYEHRRAGLRRNFLLVPKDDDDVTRIILAQGAEFWDRDPSVVNANIVRLIEVAQRRAEPAFAQFRREAARLASPDVILANGLLDIGPNSVVDAPSHGDRFEEVLTILRALLPRMIKALPGNLHATARACAKGYAEHLERCGLHPIMGLLDDFEFVVREAFQATDPREWAAGFPALMERYFARHEELKELFPRFAEREKLIASVVVDEERATGFGLVGPVQQGEEAVRQLSEAGLAAPAFAQEGLAQLERSKELAGPADPAAGADAKPRFITRLVGFYEKTVALLGNTAKLADSLAAKAVAKAAIRMLTEAIGKLLDLLH